MDLIDVLQQARDSDQPEAMTTRELRRALGWSVNKLYEVLGEKIELGLVECVQVKRRNIAGIIQTVPAFRIKQSDGNQKDSN